MKETLKERNARIEAENKRFMKMSRARRRITIARDVLAQLGTRLLAKRNVYVSMDSLKWLDDSTKNKQLQTIFKKEKECTVCAVGALFLCGIERANDLKVAEADVNIYSGSIGGQVNFGYLHRFFATDQLQLIEAAFENRDMRTCTGLDHDGVEASDGDIDDAIDFGRLFEDDEERLRFIMQNIVVNKGQFVPQKWPHEQWVTEGFKG
jgi:hypothetical protein